MEARQESLRGTIFRFFEEPRGAWAKTVQFLIFLLIIASIWLVVVERFFPDELSEHRVLYGYLNYLILTVFTIEYVVRLLTAPRTGHWVVRPLNIVDFLAVFPNYLEFVLPIFVDTKALRSLRLIRMLRFARALRALRMLRYGSLFAKVLRYRNTILQAIMPVMVLLGVTKSIIWILEYHGLWFQNPGLGELFAIIGFALGIILSQKIGVSYEKFIQVEEAVIRLHGTLRSLIVILDKVKPNLGTESCHRWAEGFLRLLTEPRVNNYEMVPLNRQLYEAISQGEAAPAELAILHGDICRDSDFCLSKKVRLMPRAYDTLLHQVTLLYLFLVAVFLPGLTGMISALVACYVLYGMYYLTQDLDSITGGEFSLINIDLSELRYLVETIGQETAPADGRGQEKRIGIH